MTRELKLAMVIGFALLLMLAIVVSDHFSTGATDHSTLVASAQPRLADTSPPVAVRRTEAPQPPRPGIVASADPPLAATTPRVREVRPVDDRPAVVEAIVVGPATRSDGSVASTRPIERPIAAVATPRTYRVAEGDSLTSIAATFYGDGELWKALADANRERLPNPDRMRVGLVLLIPERGELGGRTTAAPSVRDPLVASAARIHVVGEGETLSEIAARELGSARRWPEIVAANRDRIDDPDRVQPGTELRLP